MCLTGPMEDNKSKDCKNRRDSKHCITKTNETKEKPQTMNAKIKNITTTLEWTPVEATGGF